MARFAFGPRGQDRALFALLRGVAVLSGLTIAAVALGYSAYLSFTDLDPPDIEVSPGAFEVDPTGRRLSYGRSWLDRDGKLWRLYLEGDPVSMGDARGRLTARLFSELDVQLRSAVDRRYGAWLEGWTAAMLLRWDYRGADGFIDEAHRKELAAMALALPEADGDRLEAYHRLFLYQCVHGLGQRLDDVLLEGSMFAVAPRRSSTGEPGNLVIGRTLSVDLDRGTEPDRIVSFHRPDGRYPFVSVGWAGLVGVVTGINARGIFVALNAARTDDPLEEGSPLPLVLRDVLERADTLDQAVQMLTE
ncbi:MAG: C45 family autoproteolytic acyltransferase/hydrolase, partial [Myxococcota bacterium]